MIAIGRDLITIRTTRWRPIVTATLCAALAAVLAFTIQFVAEMIRLIDMKDFSWSPAAYVSIESEVPPLFSDGPPNHWAYSPNGRLFGSPYFTANGKAAIPEGVKDFTVPTTQKYHWQQLWYQLLFLDWLQRKGMNAGQVSAWVALLTAWIIYFFALFQSRPERNLKQLNES